MTGAVAAGLTVAAPAAGAASTGTPGIVSQAVGGVTKAVSGAAKTPIGKTATGTVNQATSTVNQATGSASKAVNSTAGGVVQNLLSTAPSGVNAPYAELANAATGTTLWNRNRYTKVPMASITKVMTAYVVIKAGNLGRVITVPSGITAYDKKYGASTAGLRPGERLTARQLLYGMLIPSGCDAAYTLASAYGPGFSGFVAKMNAAASRLGMGRTHFTDVSGLPNPTGTSTYSDADNLVKLGRAAMSLSEFSSIVGRSSYYLPASSGYHPAFSWKNTNPLLGKYSGAIGIKTGDTNAAGYCLLFEARRNGKTLIGVVLHDPSFSVVASDAEKMLNWGWSHV